MISRWGSFIIILLLSGCNHAPVYEYPDTDMPCEWQSDIPYTETSSCTWWEHLEDPVLNELMLIAKEQNLDLKIAAMRVLQARAQANGKKGDLYPHIDASINYDYIAYQKKSFENVISRKCLKNEKFSFYEFGFDAEWELDLFGMTAHEIYALTARQEALEANLSAIWVTLSAEIAKTYIELRGYQLRLNLLQTQIETRDKEIELIQQLRERGVVDDKAVTEIKTHALAMRAELPSIELRISNAIYRLSILLGYSPGELLSYLACPHPLPLLPCLPSIGIPSELLKRRPDIRKAERELAAAAEQTASAIAALFPRFSLRGFIGDITTNVGSIFNPSSLTGAIGPQILVPIFNSKLLMQDVEYNKLATQEALYTYQKVVLEALEESENALAAYIQGEKKHALLNESFQFLNQVSAQEMLRYQQGVNSYLSFATSSKKAYSAQDLLIQSEVEQLLNYVSIYKALGGDWE